MSEEVENKQEQQPVVKPKSKNKGHDNLIPITMRTPEYRRMVLELSKQGKIQKSKERRELKECMRALLDAYYVDPEDAKAKATGAQLLAIKAFAMALSNNGKSDKWFQMICDYAGLKPPEKIETTVTSNTIDIRIDNGDDTPVQDNEGQCD